MVTNTEIMMMVKQEEIKQMRREAEQSRLLREAYRANPEMRQPIWQLSLIRFGSILTYTGDFFIRVGERLKNQPIPAQPQLAREKNC